MRAWTYKSRTPLLAALLASAWCVEPRIAHCHEPIVSNSGMESIPVSRIPLPQVMTAPEQKPTSAIYSDKEIVTTKWQIDAVTLCLGTQKPVQTKSVTADWISAPQDVELLPREASAVATRAITSHDGAQKPFLVNVPAPQEIVRVQWSIASRTTDSQTVHRTVAAFQTERCPFVIWNSDNSEETLDDVIPDATYLGFSSEVGAGDSSQGKTELTSIERHVLPTVDPQTLAELQELTPMPEAGSDVTYLTDLRQLLQGESNWLFANEGLLDLAPEEESNAGVSYLEDLNALIRSDETTSANAHYRKTVASQQPLPDNALNHVPPVSNKSTNPYTSIAPDQNCTGISGAGVSSLFQTMSRIRVNGLSTAPPSRPRDAVALTAELPRPENRACQYLESFSPAYYATPARYGAPRPCRNAHVFWHRPLYYEDPNLERCGQTCGCLTTAASVMHFATAIAFTPYLVGANHPTSCVQSLPDCPTCHSFDCTAYWPGWSWKGAALQAAAVTGLYFAVP